MSWPRQMCHRMSRDGRRSSSASTSTVIPSTVVNHRPCLAIWTVATGRQSRSWQHSLGYQATVLPSGSTCVWVLAGEDKRSDAAITIGTCIGRMTFPLEIEIGMKAIEPGALERSQTSLRGPLVHMTNCTRLVTEVKFSFSLRATADVIANPILCVPALIFVI